MNIFSLAQKFIARASGETVIFKGDGSLSNDLKAMVFEHSEGFDLATGSKIQIEELSISLFALDLPRPILRGDQFSIRGQLYKVKKSENSGNDGLRVYFEEA